MSGKVRDTYNGLKNWYFRTVGQGNIIFLLIIEVFNFFWFTFKVCPFLCSMLNFVL